MAESELVEVVEDRIWTLLRPVWFMGVRLRARTTVLRLDDGALLIHSPAPPTDALVERLRALGTVRWLLIPNCFHHLGTPAAAARFPEAQVVAPPSALTHNEALRLHLEIDDARFAAAVPELEAVHFGGVPYLDETVFFHRPTQTLLGADIALSAGPEDHFSWRFAARITGCYQRLRVPPDVRSKITDKAAAARSLRALLERPARRLILGHADILEGGCNDALADAWRREGVVA